MAEKEDDFFKPTEELSQWEEMLRFIWNHNTREFCGRTGLSWLKISVFYVFFYFCLAAFWTVMLLIFYQTLDYYKPTWILEGSRIGSNPGLGFRPLPHSDNVDSTLIWFKHGSSREWVYWVNALDEYLEGYKGGRKPGESIHTCTFETDRNSSVVCHFPLESLGNNCTKSLNYGYDVGHPCVLIKLNRIYNWEPRPYDPNKLPKDMPKDLQDMYNPDHVWISCQGENPADKENIGPLKYYPSQGIPNYYFPFTNKEGYLSPFVFVHFEKPTTGVLINIECKAWADNVKHNRMERLGSVHFELLID